MRAVLVEEFGGPEQLRVVERPDPRPGPGEVLIAVAAAGINRLDLLARAGRYHRAGPPPLVPGVEGAGTVVGLGEGVTGVAVGQRVLAHGETGAPGFYASLAAVPAAAVVPVPDDVDLRYAAALPSAWLSAWYTLRTLAEVRPGETVLLHAAAGGVGSAAVQVALDAGARVIATAGTAEKRAWVAELGAHHVLDSADDVVAAVRALTDGRGADVVLDTVGGRVFADSLKVAGHAGRVVAMANVALESSVVDTRDFYPRNVRVLGFQIADLTAHGYDPRPDLEALLHGLAEGRFTVPVDSEYPLEEAAKAHRYVEERRNLGKVLLRA